MVLATGISWLSDIAWWRRCGAAVHDADATGGRTHGRRCQARQAPDHAIVCEGLPAPSPHLWMRGAASQAAWGHAVATR
jgi:hypothetical protein